MGSYVILDSGPFKFVVMFWLFAAVYSILNTISLRIRLIFVVLIVYSDWVVQDLTPQSLINMGILILENYFVEGLKDSPK
ncbi:hypothetical protein ACJX0J_020185, partial [Zea mays]